MSQSSDFLGYTSECRFIINRGVISILQIEVNYIKLDDFFLFEKIVCNTHVTKYYMKVYWG